MPKKIVFGLSVSEIGRAINEVRQYQNELAYKAQIFSEKLAERGHQIARVKIAEHDAIYTGELLTSIQTEYAGSVPDGATWYVYTDCPWAIYVEMGTGIIGQMNPHPDPVVAGWKYDTNNHGENGWYYYNDGDWHWTKGMPSRPFMYETAVDLKKTIQEVAMEVFGGG